MFDGQYKSAYPKIKNIYTEVIKDSKTRLIYHAQLLMRWECGISLLLWILFYF